jgi:hypothetical protein
MKTAAQNTSITSEALSTRKAYLTTLLKLVDINNGKSTTTQKLTITAIKAEIGLIDQKLKKR